jgi:hypothetical protein
MMIPVIPEITSTQLKASGTSKSGTAKFMPNMPETTPKIATIKVAVVRRSSNWISWFLTLSWKKEKKNKELKNEQINYHKRLLLCSRTSEKES